jgi:hypothetical protein
MTSEESAIQVDWRPGIQERNALTDQPTPGTASPDPPAVATDAGPETSVMQLSAVLIVILAGMATTFAIAAIIVTLATRG